MNQSEQSRVAAAFYLVLALALVVGFGYGVIETFRSAPQVAGPIVTALGAVLAVIAGRWWEQRQQIEQARRERVAVGYTTILRAFFDQVGDEGRTADEQAQAMREFVQTVLLWGPPKVIGEFNAWRRSNAATDANPVIGLLLFEKIVAAMRADLGSKADGLLPGDLLRTFVNDFDVVLARHAGDEGVSAALSDLDRA